MGLLKRLRGSFKSRRLKTAQAVCEASPSTQQPARLIEDPEINPLVEVSMIHSSTMLNQLDSSFLQKLPLEIRKLIYQYVWEDHGLDHHLDLVDDRLCQMRCVRYPDIDKDGQIQFWMDHHYSQRDGEGDVSMWHTRLKSTWGHHWRCEERFAHWDMIDDESHFLPLMLLCKRTHSEIMISILESHTFILTSLESATRFLVEEPSPYIEHIRKLDFTFSLPFSEFSRFMQGQPIPSQSRLKAIWEVLAQLPRLQELRIAIDVHDRGPWRKFPERDVLADLAGVTPSRSFVVELPASLPVTNPAGIGPSSSSNREQDDGQSETALPSPSSTENQLIDEGFWPFNIERREPLRYWDWVPGRVESIKWKSVRAGDADIHYLRSDCAKNVTNPHTLDWAKWRQGGRELVG